MKGFCKSKNIKKCIDQKCDMNCATPIDSTTEYVHPISWNRKFKSIIAIYIIKLCAVKYNLMGCLRNFIPQYLVVWQNQLGLHVSLNITIVFALLKPVISPTNQHFQRAPKTCDIIIFGKGADAPIPTHAMVSNITKTILDI